MALRTAPAQEVIVTKTDYSPELQPWINQNGFVRTAPQAGRFEGRFSYGVNSRFWDVAENVNGTKSFLEHQSGIELAIGTTAGDIYREVTKSIFFYQPDTVVHASTALLLKTETNVLKFWGMASFLDGEIKDGYLIRNNNGSIEFVKVSSASGTPVYTILSRSVKGEWFDAFDGKGPSGLTLDFNYLQMAELTHSWYGGGSAWLYFRSNCKSYLAAYFKGGDNGLEEPIIGNPNLPVTYGIQALDTLLAPATFRHWGLSVSIDGEKQETGALFGTYADPITVSGGAWTPILSIRLKATFSIDGATPKPNVYGYITDIVASISCSARDGIIALVREPVLTGASFTNIIDITGASVPESMVERDVSATALTGGTIILPRSSPSSQSFDIDVLKKELFSLNALGTIQPIITIAARPLAGGNSTVGATIGWREVY